MSARYLRFCFVIGGLGGHCRPYTACGERLPYVGHSGVHEPHETASVGKAHVPKGESSPFAVREHARVPPAPAAAAVLLDGAVNELQKRRAPERVDDHHAAEAVREMRKVPPRELQGRHYMGESQIRKQSESRGVESVHAYPCDAYGELPPHIPLRDIIDLHAGKHSAFKELFVSPPLPFGEERVRQYEHEPAGKLRDRLIRGNGVNAGELRVLRCDPFKAPHAEITPGCSRGAACGAYEARYALLRYGLHPARFAEYGVGHAAYPLAAEGVELCRRKVPAAFHAYILREERRSAEPSEKPLHIRGLFRFLADLARDLHRQILFRKSEFCGLAGDQLRVYRKPAPFDVAAHELVRPGDELL